MNDQSLEEETGFLLPDDQDEDDFLEDDEWEDSVAFNRYKSQMPEGWTMLKLPSFTSSSMLQIEKWLVDNCQKTFKKVGWHTGCAYSVAVQFEDTQDAILFKLRWF